MIGVCVVIVVLFCVFLVLKVEGMLLYYICVVDVIQKDNCLEFVKCLFCLQVVENEIICVQKLLCNLKLVWMFINCFFNILDIIVYFCKGKDGKFDIFVYIGDIYVMWFCDLGVQVWFYV